MCIRKNAWQTDEEKKDNLRGLICQIMLFLKRLCWLKKCLTHKAIRLIIKNLKKNIRKKRWNDRVRDILFPVILPLSGMKIRYEVKVVNAWELIPNKPVIYACNHSQFSDIPIATRAIGKRSYTLLGKQKLCCMRGNGYLRKARVWPEHISEHSRNIAEEILTVSV